MSITADRTAELPVGPPTVLLRTAPAPPPTPPARLPATQPLALTPSGPAPSSVTQPLLVPTGTRAADPAGGPSLRLTSALWGLRPISLSEVLATAALQDRVDRKYLVPMTTAEELLRELAGGFRVLEISARRLSAYSTVYFDTPELACHRGHLQGRRRRWKARTRRYLDSDLCRLELKTKGARGRTVKAALDVPAALHGRLDDRARTFLAEGLADAYGHALPEQLAATLDVTYLRATLVGDDQRLTLDTALEVRTLHGRLVGGLQPGAVLVETKAGSSAGAADRALQRLGARQTSVSKYCAATALARPDLPAGDLRPLLRRWFAPAEQAA